MIYPLTQVTGGIDKIYDVPLILFENAQTATTCSSLLFPIWFRPVYNRCPGLKDKFELLFTAFKKLNKSKQRTLIDIYRNSRNIHIICSETGNNYPNINTLDAIIRKPLKDTFEFLFNSTIGTDIFRDVSKMHINDHYKEFQNKNNVHVCPFCGLETYTLPKSRRAEYDHYLPISIYPWLSVNFNNLVPMGDHCNGKKNDSDILYETIPTTSRRAVWYPYEWINYTMILKCLKKPTIHDLKGEWEVNFKASSPKNQNKINTWHKVFDIPDRFNEHMSTFHKKFLEDFILKNDLFGERLTIPKLIKELIKYRDRGIGDMRIETMSKLKFIWADYYIKTKDSSQLAILTYSIAHKIKRPKP